MYYVVQIGNIKTVLKKFVEALQIFFFFHFSSRLDNF